MKLNKVKRKLYQYLKSRLGMRDYTRGWMKGDCPECGKEDKFGVNIGSNRSNCFVCGYGSKPIQIVVDYEKLTDVREALKFLNQFEGLDYQIDDTVERMEFKKDAVLPDSFKSLMLGKNMYAKAARNYIKKRGFDIMELSRAGFGYCTRGKYEGYIIIPFYDIDGNLIYFNARLYLGNGTKYNNPEIEDFGVGKSVILYNIAALYLYNTIFLCEGAFNARTMGDKGVASGGKSISDIQLNYIIKSPVKNVIILLDPDAYPEAIKLGLRLVNHKKVKVIKLPDDSDPNDLGRKKTLKHIREHSYVNYSELIMLKNEERA